MAKRRAAETDPGLAEIDAWVRQFKAGHAQRIASPAQFRDRHLVQQETARIEALADAIGNRMRADYLTRRGADTSDARRCNSAETEPRTSFSVLADSRDLGSNAARA